MQDGQGQNTPDGLDALFMAALAEMDEASAAQRLQDGGLWTIATAWTLAEEALEQADQAGEATAVWLALAGRLGRDLGEPAELMGQVAYAAARQAVQAGDLATAEAQLDRARTLWTAADAAMRLVRSELGLTQVLAMQGRYVEAEAAGQRAIERLESLANAQEPEGAGQAVEARLLLSRALRNRATVLTYQERHDEAQSAYLAARDVLNQYFAARSEAVNGELEREFGHIALNLATAQTFLGLPAEAEASLTAALTHFDRAGDEVNRGRTATNLGRLYLRLGEYAQALAQFDQAMIDLVGPLPPEPSDDVERWRPADELLLEHALAYLVLNLLPEADLALSRCEQLFRSSGLPYELAQTRYSQGLLFLQRGEWTAAQGALEEALHGYHELGNPFWANRTVVAQARLAMAQGNRAQAVQLLEAVLPAPLYDMYDTPPDDTIPDDTHDEDTHVVTGVDGLVEWTRLELVEAWLLRLQLWLAADDRQAARRGIVYIATLLDVDVERVIAEPGAQPVPFSHLVLRLLYARGRLEVAEGNVTTARSYFVAAVELLDTQRASLPLEEVRTSFLDDKMAIYADLVLNLLDAPPAGEDQVNEAFAVVERARSRALLERLMASLGVDADMPGEEDEALANQRAALRRRLHWLYNQLLGDEDSRQAAHGLGQELAQQENAIQQLEWRTAPILTQAAPAQLPDLQKALAADEQALLFYFAGNEVMAFVAAQQQAEVVRHLCSVQDLRAAQAELRFQLGRVEVGAPTTRRSTRLIERLQHALGVLYEHLIAPLEHVLWAKRLVIVPYGALHLLPFHALWTGSRYWLADVEIRYAPSATIAVHCAHMQTRRRMQSGCLTHFAGLAPTDQRIPQAVAEVEWAAQQFDEAETFLGDHATVDALRHAAQQSDVLHLATHGLFRPDNSFFSSLKLADGWMDVREIYRLSLQAQLVVLSACESGVGDVRGGDEVVGLTRGFLAAGAKHLVASLWNVHDYSAARFMRNFYAYLRQTEIRQTESGETSLREKPAANLVQSNPACALRRAQLQAIDEGVHPYYWAPFFVIG